MIHSMRRPHCAGLAVPFLLLASCSLGPNLSPWVEVKVPVPQKDAAVGLGSALLPELGATPWDSLTAPATVDGFDCYAVNVYGQGIGTIPSSEACSYAGLTSTLATSNQATVSLNVPSGAARTFQMIGLATGSGCNTAQKLTDYISSQSASAYALGLLGSTTADIFSSQSVVIQNAYSAAAGVVAPFNCPGQSTTVSAQAITLLPIAGMQAVDGGSTGGVATPLTTANLYYASPTPIALTAGQIAAMGSLTNTTSVAPGSLSYAQPGRVDLIYDLTGITLSNYSKIQINSNFSGENNAYPATSPGATLYVWSNLSASYVTDPTLQTTSTTNVSIQGTVGTLTPTQAATLGSAASTAISGPTSLTGSTNYLFVTVVSNVAYASGSDIASVNYVQVTLAP